MTTTNMALSLPTTSVTPGPTYADLNNSAFDLVDAHDHTTGKGVRIPSAGLGINATVEFNDNGASEITFLAFTASAAPSATKAVYVNSSNDLYYRNASGTSVQLTSGASIASVGSGVITYSLLGAYPYSVTTGNAQQILGVDTGSARTLNLPAATNAMAFWVKDVIGSAATNNISIVPAGADTIEGVASTWLMDSNYSVHGFVSDGTSKWFVF